MAKADAVAPDHAHVEKHRLVLLARVGVSLGLLYAAYLTCAQGIAWWHFRRGTADEIRRAIDWNPDYAEHYAALARVKQRSPDGADIREVVALWETATGISADHARYWTELGGAYEWAGREADARRAYEHAAALFPKSPDIHWSLGNFYIREGRDLDALRAFREVLPANPDLRAPAFDLVWRAGVAPGMILREMLPGDADSFYAYIHYLSRSDRVDEAAQVWEKLLEGGGRLEPWGVFPYFDALIRQQRTDQLKRAWATLLDRNGTHASEQPSDARPLFNGSFEAEILNGGLDWRVQSLEGVEVSLDNQTFFDGTRSLRIDFDGNQNVDYGHVLQFVPVQPNTKYRFFAYVRAGNLTTDSGPRFQIFDPHDHARLWVETPGITGTQNWTPQQVEFRTGPETGIVIVRLGRPPSRRFDNRIAGTLWVDRMSLNVIE